MNILLFPDDRLRMDCEPVKNISGGLSAFLERLKETMYINKGCVGIAAPQIGELIRAVVVDVTGHKKASCRSGLLVLINPAIVSGSGAVVTREGCLSVPDFTGNVERRDNIGDSYLDAAGNERHLETSGFEAVVIQHEVDHLDGILFTDRVKNARTDLFRRKNY